MPNLFIITDKLRRVIFLFYYLYFFFLFCCILHLCLCLFFRFLSRKVLIYVSMCVVFSVAFFCVCHQSFYVELSWVESHLSVQLSWVKNIYCVLDKNIMNVFFASEQAAPHTFSIEHVPCEVELRANQRHTMIFITNYWLQQLPMSKLHLPSNVKHVSANLQWHNRANSVPKIFLPHMQSLQQTTWNLVFKFLKLSDYCMFIFVSLVAFENNQKYFLHFVFCNIILYYISIKIPTKENHHPKKKTNISQKCLAIDKILDLNFGV